MNKRLPCRGSERERATLAGEADLWTDHREQKLNHVNAIGFSVAMFANAVLCHLVAEDVKSIMNHRILPPDKHFVKLLHALS